MTALAHRRLALAPTALVGAPLAPLALACGDNAAAFDAAPADACATRADYPGGLLGSPTDLPALTGCVPWNPQQATTYFLREEPLSGFGYSYPQVSYACEAGLEVRGADAETVFFDDALGFVRYSGEFDGGIFAIGRALCQQADGGLASSSMICVLEDGAAAPECWDETIATGLPYEMLGAPAANVTLIGDDVLDTAAFDIDIKGERAYVAGEFWLGIYDLSNPDALTLLGELALDVESINDIEVVEVAGQRIAFVGAEATQVVDVTDPSAIVALGSVDLSGRNPYAHTVQVGQRGEQLLLFLGGQDDIPVYDISVPATPVYLATVPLAQDGTHDLTIDGDTIYVNNEYAGFLALDAGDLEAPVDLGRIVGGYYDHASAVGEAGGRRLVVQGGEGLEPDGTGTHLRIYDGDPASKTYMTQLGEYATRASTGIHNMVLRDGYVFIAYYHDGLRIVDLADPSAPVEVAHYNSWDRDGANRGPFAGAIGLDLASNGDVVLLNYEGRVMRLRPSL